MTEYDETDPTQTLGAKFRKGLSHMYQFVADRNFIAPPP